jgi:hypothetical protein
LSSLFYEFLDPPLVAGHGRWLRQATKVSNIYGWHEGEIDCRVARWSFVCPLTHTVSKLNASFVCSHWCHQTIQNRIIERDAKKHSQPIDHCLGYHGTCRKRRKNRINIC